MSPGRALAPLAVMGLIFFLSAQPGSGADMSTAEIALRKLGHVTLYFALTMALAWALEPLDARRLLLAAAIALAYAISDEHHQTFVPERDGRPTDVVIDAVGIGLALATLRRLAPRRARAASPRS